MKLKRGAADLLAEIAQRNSRPVTATFQVTDRCNYECVHCYQDHADKGELTTAEIEDVLRQLADAGVLFLTLMGGEFFMRRDADHILETAHAMGFAIKLLTTGHHVHDRRADLIASLRPIQVDMSMYAATPHLHDGVTRQRGSWERTYAAARRLIERRVPVLLKAPAMESNAGDLAGLAALARELGAESSFDAKVTGKDDTDQAPVGLRMTERTLRAFYRDEGSGMADFLATTYAGFGLDRKGDGDAGDDEALRPLHHTPCRAGQQSVAINPQGDVWPCNALAVACAAALLFLFPVYWLAAISVKTPEEIFAYPPVWLPGGLELQNYVTLFRDGDAWSIWHSLVTAGVSTLIAMLFGTLAAYSMVRFRTGGGHLAVWIISQRMIPPICVAFPVFLLFVAWRWVDTYVGLITLYTAFNLPYVIWMMRGYIQEIPPELEQSALVDGLSNWAVIWKVVLPMTRGGLFATAVFTFIFAWNDFLFALILTSSEVITYPVRVTGYFGSQSTFWSKIGAMSMLGVIPIIIVVGTMQRFIVRGISLGAVKG